MRSRDFDRWVLLTLRPDGDRLFVDYADEHGARTSSGEPVAIDSAMAARPPVGDPSFFGLRQLSSIYPKVLIAAELEAWLREGFSDRSETRPHLLPDSDSSGTVPWLLPVFIQPPPVPFALPWEAWIEHLLFRSPELATRCVVMRSVPLQPVEALQLPLTLEGLGGSVPLLEGLRQRRWYAQNGAVRRYGLRLVSHDSAGYDDCDIVFRPLGEKLPDWSRDRSRKRPRLVVSIAQENPWFKRADVPQLEPEMSHLLVMPGYGRFLDATAADIVTHVVYALVHDFALHEIAWIIRHYVPGAATWTATDPRANQSLRMSSVMRDMVDDVRARRPHLKAALSSLMFDFTFESRGLTAMSNFLARTAVRSPIDVPSPLTGGHPAPPTGPAKPRRADVTVESYDAFGVLRPMGPYERKNALLRGWRYRLRVHIGWPDPASAVVGDVPAFDSLLPPPDGTVRDIEVAVFAKCFELLSPPVQIIHLPLEGETAPVHFELRAPQRSGPADLRIAFYWNNNLLQSFVLECSIAEGSEPTESDVPLTVKLASSGITEFDELEQLRPRALSVALNDDITPGSHTVMVKGTGWSEEVQLNSQEMGQTMDKFRAILEAASGPVHAGFDDTIRDMAWLGREIWNMLVMRNRGDVAVLENLRLGTDQVLQFVRHGTGRPFPWQAVYDYTPPQGKAMETARICYANTPQQRALNPGEKGCPHFPGDDVVCIEGFWFARHRFELLSEDLYKGIDGLGRAHRACAPKPNPLVMLGVGTPNLAANDLSQALGTLLGSDLVEITPNDAPVGEMLWKPERRPALLVVLSHLLEEDRYLPVRMNAFASDPESDGANISVPVLTGQMGRGRWEDPQRPIVLLLACQSARRDVGDLTSLTDAFLASGAAAVAGTEWDVMADVAANFAQHLIEQTVGQAPPVALGEAMKQFVNSCLRNSEVSAFIFTVYGNADLTIGRS